MDGTRALAADDLDRVVEIDSLITGRRRTAFFEKRLVAALKEPKHFVYVACESGGALQGYLQARLLEGEYGGTDRVATLDNIGVAPGFQGRGIGHRLMDEFEAILRHKNIGEIQTQSDWRNAGFLRFISARGFQLASRQVLERAVEFVDTTQAAEAGTPAATHAELDFSDASGDEPGSLARNTVVCRTLSPDDLPSLVHIDSKISGSAKPAYYERKVREVLEESGIRVSMVAELKGQVVGFVMARVDYGEFDRTEPNAVLDGIAVYPGFEHHQIGSALLAQLLGNLSGLRLETIRTEVDSAHLDVLGFLVSNGFRTAQELAFSCRVE